MNAPFSFDHENQRPRSPRTRRPASRAKPEPEPAAQPAAAEPAPLAVSGLLGHLSQNGLVLLHMDPGGFITAANESFLAVTGYSSYDILGCHHSMIVDIRAMRHTHMDLCQEAGDPFDGRPGPIPLITRSRDIFWIHGRLSTNAADGSSCLAGGDFNTLGARLIDQAGVIRALNVHFMVAEFDMDGTLTTANANFLHAFNFTLDEIVGSDHAALVDPAYAATEEYAAFWSSLRYGIHHPLRGVRYGKNRREVWLDAAYYPILDSKGVPCKVILVARDLTLQHRVEQRETEELLRIENVDALTGLENRTSFQRSLQRYFNPILDGRTFPGLLLVFDIDAFTTINTSYGHAAGDAILWVVGKRIKDTLRRHDLVARINGDLFAAFIEIAPFTGEGHRHFCERILAAIAEPIEVGGQQIVVTASAGMVCGEGWRLAHAAGEEDILTSALAALTAAKTQGKGGYRVFDAELAQVTRQRQTIERDIEAAMQAGEITLHFQPVVLLETAGLVGYEALARWTHPTLGAIAPPEFIQVAEQSGLIHALGLDLLAQAAGFAASLDPALWVAVNVSPIQLQRRDFSQQVCATVARFGLAPERIDIEITESASLDMSSSVQDNIRQLRDHGFSISLDDFGTGFSSLSQLLRLRADRIKIDQSFTRDCQNSQEKIGIIRSILGLSSAMGMKVVAEGIETPEISALLRELGCDYGQGYLFGRPAKQG